MALKHWFSFSNRKAAKAARARALAEGMKKRSISPESEGYFEHSSAATPKRRPPVREVSVLLAASITGPAGARYPLEVRATFSKDDPLAVSFEFLSAANPATWRFARTLVSEALEAPMGQVVGEGAVRLRKVWIEQDQERSSRLILELTSPAGGCELNFATVEVRAFFQASTALVALGHEFGVVAQALDYELLVMLGA